MNPLNLKIGAELFCRDPVLSIHGLSKEKGACAPSSLDIVSSAYASACSAFL
jgi:hypothetical protein